MRTYDDTFSGQKIYPGKVCLCPIPPTIPSELRGINNPPSSSSESSHLLGWQAEREQPLTREGNVGQTLHPR